MRNIEYKYLLPTGPDSIESKDLLGEFLVSLPHLFYMGYVPPMNVINLFLAIGIDEAGMSGGVEWKPFTIDKKEYEKVLASCKNRKYHNVNDYDFSLTDEELNSKNEWYAKVMEHKMGIPYKRHLELMEAEQSLQIQSKEAYKKGDLELGESLHLKWYQVANVLNDFCDEYFNK